MGPFILDSFNRMPLTAARASECSYGQMVPNILGSGTKAKHVASAGLF